ncbi:hypothetical protein AOLI_G00194780 [Acnodon oligacanthus]
MSKSTQAGANSATANGGTANSYNTRAQPLAERGEDDPGPAQRTNKTTLTKPMSQAVLQWKNKVEVLQDHTDELEAENSFLKQQLEEQKEGAAHNKKPDGENICGMQAKDAMSSKSSSDSTSNITEVVARYGNVLRFVQKCYRMSKAFKKVSRNAIKHSAAIAEI